MSLDGRPPRTPIRFPVAFWSTPEQVAGLIAEGRPHPAYLLLSVDEPSAAEAALAQLDAAGFTGPSCVLLPRAGVDQSLRTLHQLQTAMDNIPAPIFSKDADGVYGACNKAFEEYVGISRDKIIGHTVHEIWPRDMADVYAAADHALLAAGGSQIYEARVKYADGSIHDVTFYKGVFADERGKTRGLAGAILDITERRCLETRLQEMAERDPLTGAANRALFNRRLDELTSRTVAQLPSAVLLIDLDDFKIVNDTLGHDTGDQLLVAVTDLLRENVRAGDTVARLGGDEFAVILRDIPGPALESLVRRIFAAFAQPVSAGGRPLNVRASAGLANSRPGESGADLLRNADIALYLAKERGKGQYARYLPGTNARVAEQVELLDGLRHALADEQLRVAYQPIFQIDEGSLTGVEALARWRRPGGPLVPAEVFIPMAERTGLIASIGGWVLEQACLQARGWREPGAIGRSPDIHVNVSAHQLRQPAFADDVRGALDVAGLRSSRLVIEITGAGLIEDTVVARNVQAIRAIGVRVALDDFGAGAAGLAALAEAPVDLVKVGRSLVGRIVDSPRHARVAEAVPRLADSLGIGVIAKGVESAAQVRRLRDLGYRQAQGFYLARPLSPDDVRPFLAADREPARHLASRG